ncbi:hypothetical protein EC991_005787 [Linnemannia zychae]|nr:hypothetical protein EC991_005787 [Linnemannia zychae]
MKPNADTRSQTKGTKTKESAFSLIAAAAKRAVSPPASSRDRSISAGIAAVFVEQSKLPVTLGQADRNTHRTQGSSSSPPARPASKPTSGSRVTESASVGTKNKITPAIPKSFQVPGGVFPKNLPKPTIQAPWPKFDSRIGTTPQLALCATLLPREVASSADPVEPLVEPPKEEEYQSAAHREWASALKDPIEQDRLLWIVKGIIKKFANDATNDSEDVAEVAILGPILDREYYRELLACVIRKFDESDNLLKEHLLQAVVQLVQYAQPGYLEADDLINILGILRRRLQATHSQSMKYLYQLTLAVAAILDVMAENKVNDLDRINQHEPLVNVLSGLKGTSDPYLLYQASYAYQALQYVPNNESTTQAIVRNSMGVVESMVKLSGVLKLDVGGFLEGLKGFAEVAVNVFEVAKAGYEGASSLIESGQGIFESLGEALGSGHKRSWYTVVRRAQAFVREGRLADFCRLVIEAPCRRDPFFQWGICQLLGEIATDSNWDLETRKQAVDFLSALIKDEEDWCKDPSVKAWALTLLERISVAPADSLTSNSDASIQDHTVKDHARLQLKNLTADATDTVHTTLQTPPLLGTRLPLPRTSRLLKLVQDVPNVQYDLSQLKRQRMMDNHQELYVPPHAKIHLKALDSDATPLMDYVDEFLASDRLVLLILGDSGSGKSTFNRHLERELWKKYQPGKEKDPVPLYISLAACTNPEVDMIDEELKRQYISEPNKIKELKQHRDFILICDGYDELGSMKNLYYTNRLNQGRGHWRARMIITCRSSYLVDDYLRQFKPMSAGSNAYNNSGAADLIQEAVIVPFTEDQVKNYIDQYVLLQRPEQLKWAAEKYKETLTRIPSLMELVKNPFLLNLALDALPRLVGDEKDLSQIKVNRLILYDKVVEVWIDLAADRFVAGGLDNDERQAFDNLRRGGLFKPSVMEHLKNLARAIFEEQKGNPFVKYSPRRDRKTWKATYFGTDPETTVLRLSSPLIRSGEQNSFIHLSVLDYFFARVVYDPDEPIVDHASLAAHPLAQGTIASYPSILQFLAERVQQDQDGAFESQLLDIITNSKTDAKESRAAANAITILVKAGVRFNGADLKGIRIPGADLTGGQFDSAQLQEADLTGAALSRTWIRKADFANARMTGVRFGELPYLKASTMVRCGCYSPNGRTFCFGLSNGDLELYNTSTWTKIRTLHGHTGFVPQLAYSLNSQHIISGSNDATARLWDIQSGECSQIFDDYTELVSAVAFSPSGQQFASASGTTIRIREISTGATVFTLNEHAFSITDLAFSPNGSQLASSSQDKSIRLWDLVSGKQGLIFGGNHSPVMCIAFSPDASSCRLVSGHTDFNLYLWDTTTGELTRRITGHTSSISCVAFSHDGQLIASSGADATVRLWSARTGVQLSVLEGHAFVVESVAFAPLDPQQIASCSSDGTVRLWDMKMAESRVRSQEESREVSSVAYSPDGQHIVSGGSDKTVWQWDVSTGESWPLMVDYSTTISCLSYSPNGRQIATAGYDTAVRLNDARTGAAEHELWGHFGSVSGLAFSPCGQWIASSSFDTTAKLWDTRSGAPGIVLSGHDSGVTCVAFSPSGHQIVTGSEDGGVRIWDFRSGETALVLAGHDGAVYAVAFAPSGLHVASCGVDKTVRLWDTSTGTPCFVLRGHDGTLSCLTYSPCGKWLATGSVKGTAYLWKSSSVESTPTAAPVAVWSCALVLQTFHGYVSSISWNPCGDHLELVTGCEDRSVRVWKVVEDDDGKVHADLIWGSSSGRLGAWDANIQGVVDLAEVNKTLLLQRGAIEGTSINSEQSELYVETVAA